MKRRLHRRALLRGLAAGGLVTVGLPLLEIMLDSNGTALANGTPVPTHFNVWFFGNGVRLNRFEPTSVGSTWDLSEELQPLANVKPYLSVLTGLQNRCNQLITHHEGMTAFNGYSFVDHPAGIQYSKAGGPTIDQVIADKIGLGAPVRSIQVGCSKRISIMDTGTTMFAVSHRGTEEPLYPEFNPQKVWKTLFGEYAKPADRPLRTSVLDAVAADTKRLKGRLGQLDNQRLDAHLEGISELEGKIAVPPPACAIPGKPSEANVDVNGDEPISSVNKAQIDLLVYALKCDITRVTSMFWLGGASETSFPEIGQEVGHHFNTHDPNAQEAVHQGVLYIMQHFAYFLEQLQATVNPMGQNLLDTGLVYCSSDCSEGLSHSIARQPIILAGHQNHKLVYPGIHYQAAPPPAHWGTNAPLPAAGNTTDVLLSVLQTYDPTATSVGGDDAISMTPLDAIKT